MSASSSASLRRGGVVRTIWTLAGEHRPVLVRSVGWKAAQASAQAIPVGVLVALIERLRTDRLDTGVLGWAMAVLLTCVVAQWVFGLLAGRSAFLGTCELFGDVRVEVLDHLRRLPMSFHAEQRGGDTVTSLTQDMHALENFTSKPLQQMVGAVVSPVVVFAVLVFQDVPMAMATLVSVVIAGPAFVWSNRTFASLAGRRQDLQAEASTRMIEYVQGLAVIRAFRLSGDRLGRLHSALDDYRAVNTTLAVRLAPLAMLFVGVVLLGIPSVLFFGALWLAEGTIDAATLVVFAVLVLRVYQPLVAAALSVEHLHLAHASLDRLARVFDAPVQDQPVRPTPTPARFDLAFEEVTFGYERSEPVLREVSFSVPQGSMTAIVGPSGAGKSTVLNLVTRFWDPQAGRVTLGGTDLRDLSAEQLFDAVTVVFQDVYLFPGTIFDNIAFGRADAAPADVEAAARAARAHDFIAALPDGYQTPVGESGATLSGGERQRTSIARAILKDAPVILLDEATAAMDPTNERLVQAALAELVADKTVLVVTHRLPSIASADQVLVLDGGQVVERGVHDDLLAGDGLYARLWAERRRAANWRIATSQ